MGTAPLARRAVHACVLALGTVSIVMAAGAAVAAPGLHDPKLAKTVARCQSALAALGRATTAATLRGTGRCVARVFACDQQGGRREVCLAKAAPKCAKDLAKAEKARAAAKATTKLPVQMTGGGT